MVQDKVNIQNLMQVRAEKLKAVQLLGFKGDDLEDQHKLFEKMEQSIHDITARKNENQYLVIMPGMLPLVAIEVTESSDVPEGMTAYTLPEDEYIILGSRKSI